MGRYGQSLDLGKDLENEAAQEDARKAQENPPQQPEVPKPEPVVVVTPAAEEKAVEEPAPEEPDAPEEPPRPPDPGEEDVVEMLSTHVPHAFVPKKRKYGWVIVLLGIAIAAILFWWQQSPIADAVVPIPETPVPAAQVSSAAADADAVLQDIFSGALQDVPAAAP